MRNGIQYVCDGSNFFVHGFNDFGLDFYFLFIPSLDLVIVKPVSDQVYTPDAFYEIISSIESALTQISFSNSTKKTYKLKAVKCSTKLGAVSGIVETISRETASSVFYGHCAAYVNHNNFWFFCDDFFREYQDRPLIRKISGNAKDMFDDLIRKEQLDCGVLFFWPDSLS